MPHPPSRLRRSNQQLELGLTSEPSTLGPPSWSTLPTATQQSLTRLLTRLLVTHADRAPPQDVRAGGVDER